MRLRELPEIPRAVDVVEPYRTKSIEPLWSEGAYRNRMYRKYGLIGVDTSERAQRIRARARELLARGFVVIDTETTGLELAAGIVSIGVVDHTGRVLVDTLVNPMMPIPAEATGVHGVTDADVMGAPTWAEIAPTVSAALRGKTWVIYNAGFDVPRLEHAYDAAGLLVPYCRETVCAMLLYAEFWGDWNDYHGDWRWQKLQDAAERHAIDTGTAHNALADALTTLELVKVMGGLR